MSSDDLDEVERVRRDATEAIRDARVFFLFALIGDSNEGLTITLKDTQIEDETDQMARSAMVWGLAAIEAHRLMTAGVRQVRESEDEE